MSEDVCNSVKRVRFAPPWDELSVSPVTGLIQLNIWLAKHLPPHTNLRLVELGSLGGESAAVFEAFPTWTHLALVDLWGNEPAHILCRRRMAGGIASGRVVMHRAHSSQSAAEPLYSQICPDGPPHFVYVDADHSYESVLADLRSWYPRLAPGGFIGGHDYRSKPWPGVTAAVDEFRAEMELDVVTFKDTSFVLFKKDATVVSAPEQR